MEMDIEVVIMAAAFATGTSLYVIGYIIVQLTLNHFRR